ncbi:MAG: hypothetical protein ACI9MJ_002569, partial [Alphaproteobacteria bacterium]
MDGADLTSSTLRLSRHQSCVLSRFAAEHGIT